MIEMRSKEVYEYEATIARVVDADTVDCDEVDLGFGVSLRNSPDKRLRFRLAGIDAPERGQVGWSTGKQFVEEWVRSGEMHALRWPFVIRSYKPIGTDNFGRWLADVYRAYDGAHLNAELLAAGLAQPYMAATRREARRPEKG